MLYDQWCACRDTLEDVLREVVRREPHKNPLLDGETQRMWAENAQKLRRAEWKEARAETTEEGRWQRQELRRRRRMGDCRAIAARSWGLRPQPLLLQPRLEGHPCRLPHPCFPLAGAERPPKPWLPHLG